MTSSASAVAASTGSIAEIIVHYQRSIERCPNDNSRLLHCIDKLYKLPIKMEHLQSTGIGKTVNSLRKMSGELGVAAKTLVTKWKAMVACEEETNDDDTNINGDHEGEGGGGSGSGGRDSDGYQNEHNRKSNTHQSGSGGEEKQSRQHDQKHSSKTSTSDKERSRHKSREKKDAASANSSSRYSSSQHSEKATNAAAAATSTTTSAHDITMSASAFASTSSSSSSRHNKSDKSDRSEKSEKRENDKHHKSRERAEKSERKENEKEKERSERRREERKEVKEPEKPKSSSSSTSSAHQHKSSSSKRKTESSGNEQDASKHKESSKHRESEHKTTASASTSTSTSSSKESKDKDKHHSSKRSKENGVKSSSSSSASSKDKASHDKHKSSSSSSASSKATSSAVAAVVAVPASELKATQASTSSSTTHSKKRPRIASENDSDNDDSKSPIQAKATKVPKTTAATEDKNNKTGDEVDGIDSSMGANFADVLGMLNMPTKKSTKKSQHNSSSSGGGSGSSSAVKSTSVAAATASGSSSSSTASKSVAYSKETPVKNIATTSNRVNGVRHAPSTTHYSTDVKPDLLSSSAKLAPLDPSIALELPTISTNYKPMPLNQTVMDCVFNTSSSSASRAPVRTLTDAEAFGHGISSKTMRTKIYSGVKTGQIHQVPPLFDLCIRVLQKNVDALEYTGGVPFDVIRPVIERCTPNQLLQFEEYNSYMMEDCDVLWQQHVQRNYRTQKREEMESWREMFLRCRDDQERKLSILAESIKQSQKIIAAPVRKTQMAFVDSMVKPPRNVARKQEQFGTKAKPIATPASRVAALSSVTPNAAKTGDARLRVAASVRDAAQVSHSSSRQKKAPLMAKTLQFIRRKR